MVLFTPYKTTKLFYKTIEKSSDFHKKKPLINSKDITQ